MAYQQALYVLPNPKTQHALTNSYRQQSPSPSHHWHSPPAPQSQHEKAKRSLRGGGVTDTLIG